jgi:hypothetical protein
MADSLGTLKTAYDLAKDLVNLADATARQGKVAELQRQILDAQGDAIAANQERLALIETIGKLEKEVARLEAWEGEKRRYGLQELPPGVFARALQPAMADGEPIHRLCAKCYEDGKKSILQSAGIIHGQETLNCHGCGARMVVGKYQAPPPANARPNWKR